MIICGWKSSLELIFIRTKTREIPPKIWWFHIFFVSLPPNIETIWKKNYNNLSLDHNRLIVDTFIREGRKTKQIRHMGAIVMFIFIDIVCVASLFYLWKERRDRQRKVRVEDEMTLIWKSKKKNSRPAGHQPCGMYLCVCLWGRGRLARGWRLW